MECPNIDEVREVLQFHWEVPGDTPEFTLNRLWRKHFSRKKENGCWEYGLAFVTAAPRCLTEGNTVVTLEKWPLDKLSKLYPKDKDKEILGDENAPVVIVRFRSQDCLIDGGRRVTKWRKESNAGPHDAFVVSVKE